MRNIAVNISLVVMLAAFVSGCGLFSPEKGEEDARVVAKINNYTLTVDDLKNESKLALVPDQDLSEGDLSPREQFLEDVIIKKILIQEAQKENFDKDKTFMKEIERYWEQALLKLLLKKKQFEFAREVTVSDDEVKEEYNRMVEEGWGRMGPYEKMAPEIKRDIYYRKTQGAFDDWLADLRKNAHVTIDKKVLKEINIK